MRTSSRLATKNNQLQERIGPEIFHKFQALSEKILDQLKLFEQLQIEIDRLMTESKKSAAAQKKVQKLQSEGFFEKNNQLFELLKGFCGHLSEVAEKVKQIGPQKSRSLSKDPIVGKGALKAEMKASTKGAKIVKAAQTKPALPALKSQPSPLSSQAPVKKAAAKAQATAEKKSLSLKTAKPKKTIVSLPGGFL